MPKLKTHKGTAKRIRITRNDKVLRLHAGDKHFNQKKSSSRKRASAVETVVSRGISKKFKRALGV
jgi:large subunit ribosomal protein L35